MKIIKLTDGTEYTLSDELADLFNLNQCHISRIVNELRRRVA